jgi:hypothetical protein
MPVLVLAVSEDFNKLLEDCRLAAIAALGKLGRVVVVAVHLAVVLVVAVLGAKDGRAEGAGEVVNMILSLQGGDVGPSQGAAALVAKEAETPEVIRLAEGVLAFSVLVVGREELGRDDLAAVL